jgi:hypothetical protein
MSEDQDEEERPCLHCMMVELVDQFFEEYPAATGDGSETIDTDEVITAIAKTVADLTCCQNGTIRQQIMQKLMCEIMDYDAEFRREDASVARRFCCAALGTPEKASSTPDPCPQRGASSRSRQAVGAATPKGAGKDASTSEIRTGSRLDPA